MKPRALLVEHDEGVRRTLTLALESLGFVVEAVTSGDLAVEKIAGEMLAIAVVEARLPGALSGLETLESLKLQLPSLPVIVIAEPDRSQDFLGAFHAGAADILMKPFELEDLRTALGRALVTRHEAASLDFHARVELAKTAVASGALDIAAAHLQSALALEPLDAEVLNLLGVVAELRNDGARATRAYRIAYAADPRYGRARRNLERIMDQFAYIGPGADVRGDPLDGTNLRIAVPLLDPVRDLPLVRIAKLVGGSTCGVALGVLLDPPSEDTGPARIVAERPGHVRAAGRHDETTAPCSTTYLLAQDAAAGVWALAARKRADLVLVGSWHPAGMLAALKDNHLIVARDSTIPPVDAIACFAEGDRAAEALGLAIHMAATLRTLLVVADKMLDDDDVTSFPARALFDRMGLAAPAWVDLERHVGARRRREHDALIFVGEASESFLRLA